MKSGALDAKICISDHTGTLKLLHVRIPESVPERVVTDVAQLHVVLLLYVTHELNIPSFSKNEKKSK